MRHLEQLEWQVAEQRAWMARCGGDLAGYVARYGPASDPDKYGDGGEAIYEADLGTLRQLEAALDRAREMRRLRSRPYDALVTALLVYALDPCHAFDRKARDQAFGALRAAGYGDRIPDQMPPVQP